MKPVTIALLQTNSQADISHNLTAMELPLQQARDAGAQLVMLPEGFAQLGASSTQQHASAQQEGQPQGGPIHHWLARISQQHQLWIVAGGLLVQPPQHAKSRMRCLIYNDQGQCVEYYDKIHLFDAALKATKECYRESKNTLAGKRTVVTPTPWGRMGLSICYDLRFPELYRTLSHQQAHWICVPAAFTHTTGQAHWEILLRARAIENQCFIIAAAQTGQHGHSRRSWGHSMIIDPWGRILGDAGTQPGWIHATLDPKILQETRESMPCLTHRKDH